MKKIIGNTTGLKANQIHRIENLYRRKTPPEFIITPETAKDLASLSHEIHRQIGLLIDRSGKIASVIVGDAGQIVIPDLSDYRAAPGRLKGLRCIHTHLKDEALSRDDLTDLALLRLDMMAAVAITDDGRPIAVHAAHILPEATETNPYHIDAPIPVTADGLNTGCRDHIQALEDEMARSAALYDSVPGEERAFLVSIATGPKSIAEESMEELKELASSSGIAVLKTVIQSRRKVDPKFLMGRGKLSDLTILALQKAATMIVFDQELTPAQIRSITNRIELKVIDRTQLILDIFAQRAQTREGKLQVELAQLKYLLPRLVTKNTAMSRLTGGIGGRGPGETKLEINRRRVRDQINKLEKALSKVQQHRKQQRAQRNKKGVPVISIIGYTNAGKSTLLNTLTQSEVTAQDQLFATLDPSSRRLRFPRDIEVIITDTVGFIRDLPKELMVAFRATLEELESADLLLHVVDISNPRFREQIDSVQKILRELKLDHIPVIFVLNKMDLADTDQLSHLTRRYDGVAISAKNRSTLRPLLEKMESAIGHQIDSDDLC